MARLVAVCRADDYQFDRRQLPLVVDDNLKVCIECFILISDMICVIRHWVILSFWNPCVLSTSLQMTSLVDAQKFAPDEKEYEPSTYDQ